MQLDTAVVSVCMVNAGTAFNIIPEEVEIVGTVSRFKRNQGLYSKRIEEISTNMAVAMRAKADRNILYGPPPLVK